MAEINAWLRIHHQVSYIESNVSMVDALIQDFGWDVISECLIHPKEKAAIRRESPSDEVIPRDDEALRLVKLVSIYASEHPLELTFLFCESMSRVGLSTTS